MVIYRLENAGLAMLFGHILHYGIKNIPPGTLTLIAGQTALFMDPGFLPNVEDACISSYLILYAKDWLRFVLSPFYHGSDMHLYYNMLSLLYKGSWLEKKFGTLYFLYLTAVFTTLINGMYLFLGVVLTKIFNDDGYLKACAVGFSGVLFAMKVLTTHYAPRGPQMLMGIHVPSKYIYWAELVLIQLMVPNASFVGHLAGILIGCAYIWGPLQYVMDKFVQPPGSSVDPPSAATTPRQQSLENLANANRPPPPPTARTRPPSLDIIGHGSTQGKFPFSSSFGRASNHIGPRRD